MRVNKHGNFFARTMIFAVMCVLIMTTCFTPAFSEHPNSLKELAGTWSGIGTPVNGGTAIELSITIKEDGRGDYLFSQGDYMESFPFSVAYSEQAFSVDVPETAGIDSITGTYQLQNNLLLLNITTTFPDGRQYKYTAECTKTAGDPSANAGSWACPNCQMVNQGDWNYCVSCGTKRPEHLICPGCNEEYALETTYVFCPACGTRLPKTSSSAPSTGGDSADSMREMYVKGTEAAQAGYYEEAADYFRKSADQGYDAAQFSLGVLYENGSGIDQSFPKAAYYYSLAAEQGNKQAAEAIERMEKNDHYGITLIEFGAYYKTDNGTKCLVGQYVDESLFPNKPSAGIYYTLNFSQNIPERCIFYLIAPDGKIWVHSDTDLNDASGQSYMYTDAKDMEASSIVPGEYIVMESDAILGRCSLVRAGKSIGSEYVSSDGPIEILYAGYAEKNGQYTDCYSLNLLRNTDPDAQYGTYILLRNTTDKDIHALALLKGERAQTKVEIQYKFEIPAGKTKGLFSKTDLSDLPGDYYLRLNGKDAYHFVIVDGAMIPSVKP